MCTLSVHCLHTVHTIANHVNLLHTHIKDCTSFTHTTGKCSRVYSLVPCGLKIEEDVDHCAVALPDLSAVALDFNPKQQHDATVPASVQVNLKVTLPARVKWLGRHKKDIIHPQVLVELFEWLAVYILTSSVILVSYFEARVHANLWSCMHRRCVRRSLQCSQKFLDLEWKQLFVLAIWWW